MSGLLACKYALEKGYRPIVFEADRAIGGIWAHTIESTRLQTPREGYSFSDFPWPPDATDEFPDHNQVMDYFEAYARRFDLKRHIKFNKRVLDIDYVGVSEDKILSWDLWSGTGEALNPSGWWQIRVQDTNLGSIEIYEVGFVILCVGHFSGVPNVPDFPVKEGPEMFGGDVIHAMDYSNMDDVSAARFVKGKRVTVVGFQKSALDIAAECARANGVEKPCTMICRTPSWFVPNYKAMGVSVKKFYLSRFSELFVHKPGEGTMLSLLATKWMFSKVMESHLRWKFPLKKYDMVPDQSFSEAASACRTPMLPNNFYNMVEEGSIVLKRSKGFKFCEKGVIVDGDEAPIEADLVIFATGYKGDQKLRDIFKSTTFQKALMGTSTAVTPLYRECIHPRIPQLAIIGFLESPSSLFPAEMRCKWLSHLLGGGFKLPSVKSMEAEVAKWERYIRRYSGEGCRWSCVGTLHIWFNDKLCKDMGWSHNRKKGFLSDWLSPYGPADYAEPSTV
ncbi:putative flavin-containing monooxygenase 1 [Acorus calamus]|uniref:Flavin-containing monooxygenase n=1 Tax=Acorus calamus TaxID=4465 RepID=A0AAV9D7N3_ACOCL|nr:putative flavin-containing monooxygenase 1 [Acorus calamus]